MKLLVFAHTPPPHHGQSYMVQLMLDGLRKDFSKEPKPQNAKPPIQIYHVNAQISDDMQNIGSIQITKFIKLIGYCLQAIWFRFRYRVNNFYYIPAPAKRSAIYRDWIVMLLCRPFFQKTISHWHAVGLGSWVATTLNLDTSNKNLDSISLGKNPLQEKFEAWVTKKLLSHVDLSLSLTEWAKDDAEVFQPKKIKIIPNGIPDPCPNFEKTTLPYRLLRLTARLKLLNSFDSHNQKIKISNQDLEKAKTFKILYMAHCTRDKGLFDTLDAIALVKSQICSEHSPITIHLTVAGKFMNKTEEKEFQKRIKQPDLKEHTGEPLVNYIGFASGQEKHQLLKEHDCFCFPTYYRGESFGLVLCEAMAYGLPIVTSNWRMIPELMTLKTNQTISPQNPQDLSNLILSSMTQKIFQANRKNYITRFSLKAHIENLKKSLY